MYRKPLLQLAGMPAAAQNFPDEGGLIEDVGVDLNLFQCSGCGLVQLDSAPVDYYKDVIRASAYSEEMRDFRLSQFKTLVETHDLQGKKVLELGCGQGEYLVLMAQAGVDAFGLEHRQESVDICRAAGLKVSQGYPDLADMALAHGPFDAFFILNFFEHLPEPGLALDIMRNNLVDEGLGLIEVPNFEAIVDKKLFSEFVNDHLFYFTRETLTRTLELNGFEVLSVDVIWYDYILTAVVRKRAAIDLKDMIEYRDRISTELGSYLDLHVGKTRAIWGAGHQALAVIALAELAGKIDLVVDSATFKQGRFTPATHIPIKAPSAVKTDSVEVIIVMAAAYSDEVVRIIDEQFPELRHLAILRDYGLEFIRE